MAGYIRMLGRLTGRALRSHAFDRLVTVAAGYVASEMKLADLKAKRALLRQKRANHMRLLGRTVYRLVENDIDPFGHDSTGKIVRVIDEIDREIRDAEEALDFRRRAEREKREREKKRRGEYGTRK